MYQNELGPVLTAIRVEPANPADPEVATFLTFQTWRYGKSCTAIAKLRKAGGSCVSAPCRLASSDYLGRVYGQEHILGKRASCAGLLTPEISQYDFLWPQRHGKDHRCQYYRKADQPHLGTSSMPPPPPPETLKTLWPSWIPLWPPMGCCCIWTRFSPSTKSSSKPCWNTSKTEKSPLSPPPRRIPISMCSTPSSAVPRCLSSSRFPGEAALQAIRRAVAFLEKRTALTAQPEEGALEYIAGACGGDLRKAMNAVEVLFSVGVPQGDKLP